MNAEGAGSFLARSKGRGGVHAGYARETVRGIIGLLLDVTDHYITSFYSYTLHHSYSYIPVVP